MKNSVKELINRKGSLAENEVKDLLKAYGIRTTKYKIVKNIGDLEKINLKFPVALKVCSNKILHKTEVGGVKLGIENLENLRASFVDFRKKFPRQNFLVDQMEEKVLKL